MGFDFRMPNITGTDREQLAQIRSYLYQLIPQLQWALSTLDTSSTKTVEKQVIRERAAVPSSTALSPEENFNAIKGLIIKSADIVEAYYDEINTRLIDSYRALSDFGEYSEQTEKLVRETAALTEETYSRLASIDEDLDGVPEYIRKTKGYIRTGIIVNSLSKEEANVYDKKEGDSLIGIEVGESYQEGKTELFRRFARFTPGRLSFYDQSENEVAYISNYMLYIRYAEITEAFQIGGYKDIVKENGRVITKWVGGNAR